MRVVVVGPGALGCLFSALLQETGGCDLWLLDHDRERASVLQGGGIQVDNDAGSRVVAVPVTADARSVGGTHCILLCVKSPAVAQTLPAIAPLCSPNSLLVTLQNGIAHLDVLRAWATPSAWATGITAQGATLLTPGRVRHAGKGPTRIGFLQKPLPHAEELLQEFGKLLDAAGIPTSFEANILNHIWSKLLVNAGINALTAIHDCPNGELLQRADLRRTMLAAVQEAAAVARALGIAVAGDPEGRVLEVAKATATNISSMLQDVRNRRITEIEAINGEIVKMAKSIGISVPTNELLLHRVQELERSYSRISGTFP